MKKLFLTISALLLVYGLNAQSLEEIINKYTTASKLDKISGFKTLKFSANTVVMNMDLPMEMWMKNPNKIKTVASFNGQEMIQVFDGEKGYIVNPMTGSSTPTEMNADQVNDIIKSNFFNNYLAAYLKDGKLTLDGSEAVNGKPAFKLKAALPSGTAYIYIDKESYLLVKSVADVNQGGMSMTVETYPSDYADNNGIMVPMKTTTTAGDMEMVTTFTKVEVDVPMDDAIFTIK